jgi:hypothetical protein
MERTELNCGGSRKRQNEKMSSRSLSNSCWFVLTRGALCSACQQRARRKRWSREAFLWCPYPRARSRPVLSLSTAKVRGESCRGLILEANKDSLDLQVLDPQCALRLLEDAHVNAC